MPAPAAPALGNLTSSMVVGEKGIPTAPDPVRNAEGGTVTPPIEMSGYGSDCTRSEDLQDGIKKVEAIVSVWSKKELTAAYAGCAVCLICHLFLIFLGGARRG